MVHQICCTPKIPAMIMVSVLSNHLKTNAIISLIGGSQQFNEDTSDLYIDHQKMLFNQGLTLSWKPLNSDKCRDYEVTSRKRCGRTSQVVKTWHNIAEPNINISANLLYINQSGEIENRADFIIKAVDNDGFVCSFTKATMQVQKGNLKLYHYCMALIYY